MGEQVMGRGQGRNKKQAELNAARQALETLAATSNSVRESVPKAARPPGIQEFRRPDDVRVRARHHGDRRSQRQRQVQHRRRPALGARRAVRPPAAGEEAGGHHLRRVRQAGALGPRRSRDDAGQLQRLAAAGRHGGGDLAAGPALRRQRLLHQRQEDAPARDCRRCC